MGSYRFKWPHPADEVLVTGTFDNWSKSIKLDKKNWVHEKTVDIPSTQDEILYKFVVNGEWRTDPSHAVKRDHEGNENNVLDPEDIMPTAAASGLFLSSAAAGSSTAALAGAQPLENNRDTMPGAFPVTPMESGPTPTLQDRVVGVNPIPATSGIGNPVQLKPGEKVPDPSTLTDNTIGSTVTTDKASYESGANGAAFAPVGKVDDSAARFGRPAAGGTIIPESGLPMGDSAATQKDYTDPAINSAGAGSSTAALAGQQPIEPRGTPQVIRKDDNNDGIAEKAAVGAGVAGVTAAGAAVAANEVIKDKTGKDAVSTLPQSTQDHILDNAKDSKLPAQATGADRETAPNVPQEVTESQKEANQSPEAAANPEAVQEKSEAEKELLAKTPKIDAQGEPAPTATAATAATVPTTTSDSGAPQLGVPAAVGAAPISMDDKPSDANVAALKASSNAPQHPRVTSGVAEGSTSTTTTPNNKRQSMVDRLKTPKSEAGSSQPSTPGSTSKSEKRKSFMSRLKEKVKNL